MIVLDASALIAFLDPSDALHERAVAGLVDVGPQDFGMSPITHAAVLVGPTRAKTLEATRAALSALGVAEVALPPDAAERLADLRAGVGLKLPDCCVILAAQQTGAHIMTFDDRLAVAGRRLGLPAAPPSSR